MGKCKEGGLRKGNRGEGRGEQGWREDKEWQRSEEVKEEVERGDGKCKAVKVDEGEEWGSVKKAV